MRKRTIFRSSRMVLVILALLVAFPVASSGIVSAQEPQPQQPAVHVVSPGETLWSLAQRYRSTGSTRWW